MDNSEPGEDKDSDTMVTGTKGEAHLVKSCTETNSPSPPIGGGETPVQVKQAILRTRLQLQLQVYRILKNKQNNLWFLPKSIKM